MLPLLIAFQLAITPVPVAAQEAPTDAPQTTQHPAMPSSINAEIPASTYGLLAGALALGWGLIRLGERALDARAEKKRKASEPPPSPHAAPGGLPTATCDLFHKSMMELPGKLDSLASACRETSEAVQESTEATDKIISRLDRFIAFEEGRRTPRAGVGGQE